MSSFIDTNFDVLSEIDAAYSKARRKHAAMKSPHEGYAIMLEEFDELWAEIKAWQPPPPIGLREGETAQMRSAEMIAYWQNNEAMRKEALHVAAMALAFIIEVCDREPE